MMAVAAALHAQSCEKFSLWETRLKLAQCMYVKDNAKSRLVSPKISYLRKVAFVVIKKINCSGNFLLFWLVAVVGCRTCACAIKSEKLNSKYITVHLHF